MIQNIFHQRQTRTSQPGDVFTIQLCKDSNLLHNIVNIVLGVVKINNFNRNDFVGILMISIQVTRILRRGVYPL